MVASVIGFQLVIVTGVLAGCLFTQDKRCTGELVSEMMLSITAQTFALYAAEK